MLREINEKHGRSFWHRLEHVFGVYTGEVVSWTASGLVWIGFQCGRCGAIEGVHVARGGGHDA